MGTPETAPGGQAGPRLRPLEGPGSARTLSPPCVTVDEGLSQHHPGKIQKLYVKLSECL